MRPVALADIDVVARVLLACSEEKRGDRLTEICHAADVADRYRKRLGKQHPHFGCGTLMSAAIRYPRARQQSGTDHNYLICMQMVAAYLSQTVAHHPS